MHQDVRHAVQEQSELIGAKFRTRQSVGKEMIFMFFDHQLHGAAAAAAGLVQSLSRRSFKTRDYKAYVDALVVDLDLGNDA